MKTDVGRSTGSRRSVACAVSALAGAVALAVPAYAAAQSSPSRPSAPLVVNFHDVAWGPPGTAPRFPAGVQTVQLGVDPDSGGPTYLARFPAGSRFDLHWHTHDEYVVVMSGNVTLVLGDETHALVQGDYVVIPGAMNHSWDVPPGEPVIILVRRAGPADFNFVDP